MKKFITIILAFWLLFLTACQTETKTPAEAYLDNHSEQEIVDYFSQVTLFFCDFNDPKEIPEKNLYTFAMFHDKDSWQNETGQPYYIPLADIYDILDNYLIDYNLPITWFENLFGNEYDAENQQIITGAIGMGTGCTAFKFISAETIDDDKIKVALLIYCKDIDMEVAGNNVYITAQIIDDQIKFTSCQTVKNN